MAKKLLTESMEPGKKYKGYGFINEAHEFCFTPEDTGSRDGQIKHLAQSDGASVSYSNKFIFAKLKLKRTSKKSDLLMELARKYNALHKILLDYDF